MYAIIEDSGTQIKVSPGDILDIDLRTDVAEQPTTVNFDRVLLLSALGDDAAANIGQPYIDGASVTADVLDEVKGEKLTVFKYKRRKGYRRKMGHRQRYLRIKVTGIKA